TGPERFFTASGFIMSFQGEWYYVTAGHVLQTEIDEQLATRQILITRAVLVAPRPAYQSGPSMQLIPIPYADTPRAYIDDRDVGLDIGLMHLRTLFRAPLEGLGVQAIAEEQWRHQHLVRFDFYFMLGYPAVYTTGQLPPDRYGEAMNVSLQATFIPVQRQDQMP